MKKFIVLVVLVLSVTSLVYAQSPELVVDQASDVQTDTSNFGGILSGTEDTVQKALDVIDDISIGETNTASNVGSLGVGLFKQKTVSDLEFYKIYSANNRLTAAIVGADYLALTLNEANIDHNALTNYLATEHVDWAGSGAGTIHTDNYIEGHSNGANCSSGSYPLGVDASGAVESCTDATTEIDSVILTHKNIADAHHTATVETNSLETTITGILDTEIFIGNGADSGTYVPMSGDATMTNAGVVEIVNDSHTHSTYATLALDNLVSTAVNASIIPATDSAIDLGSTTKYWRMTYTDNLTFLDLNDETWDITDMSRDLFQIGEELGVLKFNTTAATAAGVRTITLTQPDALNLDFIINKTREEHTGSTMTYDMEALTGTDASPNAVYTYVDVNAGAPRLIASNTSPDGGVVEHVDGIYEITGAIAGTSANVYATRNVRPYTYEKIEKILDRFADAGMLYKTGMVPTVSAASFAITTGTAVMSVNGVSTPALTLDGATDDKYVIQSDGTYVTSTGFDIAQYYDGVVFASTEYMRARIGIVVNNPEGTSARLHVIPQNGSSVYDKAKDAWRDKSNVAVLVPTNDTTNIVANAFIPIADIVIYNNAGTYTLAQNPDTLLYYSDVRTGGLFGGGSGGSVSQNLWETVAGDSGSTIADLPNDTLTISGGTNATTAVAGDTVTINVTAHTTDTSANTECAGTTTYLDGDGVCDDISLVYQPLEATLTDIADGTIAENLVNTANPWADNEVADNITASSYLPLAGGTMTGSLITDNLGIEFEDSDTNPTCGAGEYKIYADLSETTFKKCMDGAATDLDTGGAETNDLESVATSANDAEIFVGTGVDTGAYIAGLAPCANDAKLEYVPGTPDTFVCENISGLIDAEVSNILTASLSTLAAADSNNTFIATTSFVQQEINGSGGTNLTASGGVLSVDDVFLSNSGDIGTGVYDFGGATSLEIPNTAGDVTVDATGKIAIDSTQRQLGWNDGTVEIAIPAIHIAQGTFDLASQWDLDPDLWLMDLHADRYPDGIVITAWAVDSSIADPTTELNANLNYADAVGGAAFPGANATLIDVLDTTTGNSSESTMSNSDLGSGVIPTGKTLYITLDADPVDATTTYHLRINFYIPES